MLRQESGIYALPTAVDGGRLDLRPEESLDILADNIHFNIDTLPNLQRT